MWCLGPTLPEQKYNNKDYNTTNKQLYPLFMCGYDFNSEGSKFTPNPEDVTMFRHLSFFAVLSAIVLASGQARAGGPPMLCLPIDGVTAENVDECTKLLTAKLESKLFPKAEEFRPIEIRQFGDQWYLTFYFADDVALSEVEAALEGSSFSIPRDRLHIFGHVVLEIDAGAIPSKELVAGLEALELVSVGASEATPNHLLLTVDMPYPEKDFRAVPEAIDDSSFQPNDLSSDLSAESSTPATAEQLPNYNAFQEVLAKRDAKLSDIRWTTAFACRSVGGVAVPQADGKLSKTAQAAISR
jgi:hypothetical protein